MPEFRVNGCRAIEGVYYRGLNKHQCRVIHGAYWHNGKDNGNYYSIIGFRGINKHQYHFEVHLRYHRRKRNVEP